MNKLLILAAITVKIASSPYNQSFDSLIVFLFNSSLP